MNRSEDGFDARMRRQFAGIDTSPGFATQLAARVAAIAVEPAAARRARADRQREEVELRLRREAWASAATAAGIGAAAIAAVWRHAPAVAEQVAAMLAALAEPRLLGHVAVAALAAAVWPVLQRYLPR
jgi:hypothetical protein